MDSYGRNRMKLPRSHARRKSLASLGSDHHRLHRSDGGHGPLDPDDKGRCFPTDDAAAREFYATANVNPNLMQPLWLALKGKIDTITPAITPADVTVKVFATAGMRTAAEVCGQAAVDNLFTVIRSGMTTAGLTNPAQAANLNPALTAAECVLPRDGRDRIDGFVAREGVICECFQGILAPPPETKPQPFNLIFETPALAPLEQQVVAAVAALDTILAHYRGFIAHAQGI